MFKFTHSVCLATALLSAPLLFAACSTKPQHVEEPKETMPTEYPKSADAVIPLLADMIPLDADVLAFSSYGSLTDAIHQFDTYKVVDSGELHQLMTDLGTHYHLDPGDLKSYYNAGLHTGSGLAVGQNKGSVFIVFDILSEKKFNAWWDTFVNEEFGRPRYHTEKAGDTEFTTIHVLKKDFASLAHQNGKMLVVLGEAAFPGSPNSQDALKTILNGPKLAGSAKLTKAAARLSHAPIAVLASESSLDNIKHEKLRDLRQWCTDAGLELSFGTKGPEIRAFAALRDDAFHGTPRAKFISELTNGTTGKWAGRILDTNPTSVVRVLYDAQKLENFLLPTMPQSTQRQYADIKDKLTQRLLKLDIEDQVIHNSASAWAALYGATAPKQQNPSLTDMLLAQNLAIFLPMKDAAKADSFFGKVSVLKRFIPENLATIDPQSDMLHAIVRVQNAKIHVAYADGLIAAASEKIWPTVSKIYDAKATSPDSPLLLDTNMLAGTFKTSDITSLLGAKYAIVKEQIETFLAPFDSFTVTSASNADIIECRAFAQTR
ncbi:MAG: hypothetical protein II180_12450 [Proteobacteria bacterium]|nr:hypothetical protein [Pseudomonadota bacterium]